MERTRLVNHPKLAKDIMVTNLVTLRPDHTVGEGIARLVRLNHTGAPVIEQDHTYLGMFSEKVCLDALIEAVQGRHENEIPLAQDVMRTSLVTLAPDADVFDAIDRLLLNRISGAPVLDSAGRFLGVFSEKTSMSVLVDAAYEQLPTSRVEAYVDRQRERTFVAEGDNLVTLARLFVDTEYRRAEVLRDGALLGQISRRDVVRALWAVQGIPTHPLMGSLVGSRGDNEAQTIHEELDFLGIVQIFRQTGLRRLPVLRGGNLMGQISRRDLLQAVHNMLALSKDPEKSLLYLSSLMSPGDAPF